MAVNTVDLFAESLCALNTFVYHRAVLGYQQDIVDRGRFEVLCPWRGETLYPSACHITNNGDPAHGNLGIAYRLNCEPAIWLLTNSIKDGFPITEAYLPIQDASIWALSELWQSENAAWKGMLREIEQGLGRMPLPQLQRCPSAILMGHPNFAHHFWNELPALHALVSESPEALDGLELKTIYEPFLPITELVDRSGLSLTRLERFEDLVGFQDRLVTRLGSTQISRQLRLEVRDAVCAQRDKAPTDPIAERLSSCGLVIWLSVRLDARTADNQREFLLAVITRFAEVYPSAGFILDGFSYPDDFDSPIYRAQSDSSSELASSGNAEHCGGFLSKAMIEREGEVTAYIEGLRATLERVMPNTVVSTSGMGLVNSIYLARFANYYVCHAGTLQHKIAWLYDTDGIVHSNITGVQPGVPNWLAEQLQGGIKPALVPEEYINDLETIRTATKVERNRDYHFVDIEGVVTYILGNLQASLDRR